MVVGGGEEEEDVCGTFTCGGDSFQTAWRIQGEGKRWLAASINESALRRFAFAKTDAAITFTSPGTFRCR